MASCNSLNLVPIKVSQLTRYKTLDTNDFIATIESGSKLYSRRSTIADLKNSLGEMTGSYTGSFSGSFVGKAKVTGSFYGSYWGNVVSVNTVASGSFSGSYYGKVLSKNTIATGSFKGSIVSTNTIASGSFSGSYYGKVLSKNTIASGSFSGSYWGSVISKNTKSTGSFRGSVVSTNTIASGSFSGSYRGSVISKNGIITGSFRGVDNILNFRNTGKKVSFNGTSSYAVSASYANTASAIFPLVNSGQPIAFSHAAWTATTAGVITPLTSLNVSSITLYGIQPTTAAANITRYADISFIKPVGSSNYTVLAYCSWDNPFDILNSILNPSTNKHFADIGTSVVSNRTSTGFRITTFVGWYAGTAGDGDDYWYNTSIFPDYSSFVVFK